MKTKKPCSFTWILKDAEKCFKEGMNWIDFSNRFFDHDSQYMPKDPHLRKMFLCSEEFKKVMDMKTELEKSQPEITKGSV
jgi:hypothetical protein